MKRTRDNGWHADLRAHEKNQIQWRYSDLGDYEENQKTTTTCRPRSSWKEPKDNDDMRASKLMKRTRRQQRYADLGAHEENQTTTTTCRPVEAHEKNHKTKTTCCPALYDISTLLELPFFPIFDPWQFLTRFLNSLTNDVEKSCLGYNLNVFMT